MINDKAGEHSTYMVHPVANLSDCGWFNRGPRMYNSTFPAIISLTHTLVLDHMHHNTVIEIHDDGPTHWVASEWIGRRLRYPSDNTPQTILDARRQVLMLPQPDRGTCRFNWAVYI